MSPMKSKKSSPIKARKYWRSLNHLEHNEEYKQWLHREFPEGASEMNNDWSRRNFLALMGASLAIAGLEGCRRPVEKIVPYVERPEEVVPGNPLYFATSMPYGMGAYGLLVKSREGRPVFIEGNKLHPVNKGSANIFVQAEILNLYDPDRSKRISKDGVESSWEEFISFWRGQHEEYRSSKGKGLAVIAPAVASPTVARLWRDFDKQFPNARWVTYEPVSDENIYEGVRMATGETRQSIYSYDKAKVILSLDSDFLRLENDDIPAARGFADGRRVETRKDDMNRLYVVESDGQSVNRVRVVGPDGRARPFAGRLRHNCTSCRPTGGGGGKTRYGFNLSICL